MAESNFTSDPNSHHPPPAPGQKYRFTPEELRCLKECNRESFYFRSLPIGSVLAAGTYYAIRYGYIAGSPRFGVAPKVIIAGLTGYFVGKFSYQQKCVDKIMQLPNSPLGEMLRKQRAQRSGGAFAGFSETLTLDPGFSTSGAGLTGYSAPSQDESYSTSSYFSDVSDTRPMADSYDTSEFSGSYRENELQMREDTLPPKPPQFSTSYDELRRQNRDDYERKSNISSLHGIPDNPPRRDSRTGPQNSPSGSSQWSQFPNANPAKSNVYGDMWDEKSQ